MKDHLRSVVISSIDGTVPSGCSYSTVSSLAIFNSHPAGGNGWLPDAEYKLWLAHGREVNRSAYTLVCHAGVADRNSRTLADGDGDSQAPASGDSQTLAIGDGRIVWWLHIPKCGSSFSRSAGMYRADPNRNGGTHAVLPADADEATLGRVITMFRAPKQRLMSMYEYMKRDVTVNAKGEPHFYGAGFSWGWNMVDAHVVRNGIYNNGSVAETLGSFVGCQANAVLGHRCLSRNLTDVTAAKAIERAGQFRFIGLEIEWALSVCLFNYAMSGTRYVTQGQLVNLRPTDSSSGLPTEYDETGVPDDPIDDELYAWAEARFEQQLKDHNISESTCPDYADIVGPVPGVPTSAQLRRAEGQPMQYTDDPDSDAEQESASFRFYNEFISNERELG